MAHFARLDSDNKVIEVHCLVNDVITDSNGDEQESLGIKFLQNHCDTSDNFVQTSYNNKRRKQFAGRGYTYDSSNDVFVSLEPYPSWTLDGNHDWQPPTAMPDDGKRYSWNEETTSWDEI